MSNKNPLPHPPSIPFQGSQTCSKKKKETEGKGRQNPQKKVMFKVNNKKSNVHSVENIRRNLRIGILEK